MPVKISHFPSMQQRCVMLEICQICLSAVVRIAFDAPQTTSWLGRGHPIPIPHSSMPSASRFGVTVLDLPTWQPYRANCWNTFRTSQGRAVTVYTGEVGKFITFWCNISWGFHVPKFMVIHRMIAKILQIYCNFFSFWPTVYIASLPVPLFQVGLCAIMQVIIGASYCCLFGEGQASFLLSFLLAFYQCNRYASHQATWMAEMHIRINDVFINVW